MDSRGQALASDYIVSFGLFLLVFGVCAYAWDKVSADQARIMADEEMRRAASRAADQLVLSPGDPWDWESDPSAARAVGAASSDRVLSGAKLAALESLDSAQFRAFLGAGGLSVYVRVYNSSGHVFHSFGEEPAGQSAVNSRRVVAYGGATALVDTIVWEPYSAGGPVV